MNANITKRVKQLLVEYPETRDCDWLLAIKYLDLYFDWTPREFIEKNILLNIRTARQVFQRVNPDMRWKRWAERQRYSHEVKQKIRNQEKPENLMKQFDNDEEHIKLHQDFLERSARWIDIQYHAPKWFFTSLKSAIWNLLR